MLNLMLKARTKQLKKNQKGFTLVELIVVVAILGILAALAIGRFGGITTKAKERADISSAATLAAATSAYLAEEPNGTLVSDTAPNLAKSDGKLKEYLDSGASYKTQSVTGNPVFFIDADKDGNIKITAGTKTGEQFYPAPGPATTP